MLLKDFTTYISRHAEIIEHIRQSAHALHASVNQTYGGDKPYGFHLDMVAQGVMRHAHSVCAHEADILPIIFAAFYHDSIEDARLTYNDVLHTAQQFMRQASGATPDQTSTDAQALMAAEIVYALTNEKGRTRAERAGERYYQGIRQTPYAPLVKLADRLANTAFSASTDNAANSRMRQVYAKELPHFLNAIDANSADPRLQLPPDMVQELVSL